MAVPGSASTDLSSDPETHPRIETSVAVARRSLSASATPDPAMADGQRTRWCTQRQAPYGEVLSNRQASPP